MHRHSPQKHLSLGMAPYTYNPAMFGAFSDYNTLPTLPATATTATAATAALPNSPFSLSSLGIHSIGDNAAAGAAEAPYVSPLLTARNSSVPPVGDSGAATTDLRDSSPLFTCQSSRMQLDGFGTTFPESFPFIAQPQRFSFDISQLSGFSTEPFVESPPPYSKPTVTSSFKRFQQRRQPHSTLLSHGARRSASVAQPLCMLSRPSTRKVAPRITVDEEFFLPKNKIKEKEEEIHSMILTLNRHFGISD